MKFKFLRPYTHQQRPIKHPKIRQRWPILLFEINHFLQGRPPKISCNHQHRPIKKRLKNMCTLQTLFPP